MLIKRMRSQKKERKLTVFSTFREKIWPDNNPVDIHHITTPVYRAKILQGIIKLVLITQQWNASGLSVLCKMNFMKEF